jgi:hypothetical protein
VLRAERFFELWAHMIGDSVQLDPPSHARPRARLGETREIARCAVFVMP